MQTINFQMFTDKGNYMVTRIAEAARELSGVDGPQNPTALAKQWAERELNKLSSAAGFEEATDTAVREAVMLHIEGRY